MWNKLLYKITLTQTNTASKTGPIAGNFELHGLSFLDTFLIETIIMGYYINGIICKAYIITFCELEDGKLTKLKTCFIPVLWKSQWKTQQWIWKAKNKKEEKD